MLLVEDLEAGQAFLIVFCLVSMGWSVANFETTPFYNLGGELEVPTVRVDYLIGFFGSSLWNSYPHFSSFAPLLHD